VFDLNDYHLCFQAIVSHLIEKKHIGNVDHDRNCLPKSPYLSSHFCRLSGQHYNQCDKATNKDQAREKDERERER